MTFKSLLILPLLVASLQAADVDDLTFVLNEAGTEYSLTDCNESATDSLDIPSSYRGLPVTSIGDSAFYRCTGLTSITIPDSVTSIEGYAFYTSSLTSIIIPDSVISIGDYVFYRSPNLASVTIGNGVTSIGVYAFYDCTSLSSITIGESVASIGERAFRNCTSLSSITIPDSVTEIRDYLFYGCSDLASVTIGNGVTSIGSYAFSDCTTLTSITIPDSVTSIVFSAFEGCSNLTSVSIPDNVTSIGRGVFLSSGISFSEDSNSIKYLISASGNTAYLIDGKSSSGNVFLPNTFSGASVTLIADGAFQNCTGLTGITIPDSVTSIGDSTFSNCRSLSSFTIPDSVTSIGNNAFDSCSSLTSITIPNSVTSIGERAFRNCTSLSSITIPDSVTEIRDYLFYGCSDLASVTIGNGVTSIGSYAFSDCTTLTSITIPDSVTSIGSGAFDSCSSLTSITIPNSVTSIGERAFRNCTSLAIVKFEGDAPTSEDQAFDNILASYMIVEDSKAESYGGDGATYSGLAVVDTSEVATAANLYTKSAYDTIVAERDAALAAQASAEAERDAKLTLDEVKDLRAGSTMIAVENETATLSMEIEKSSDLTNWTFDKTTTVDIPIEDGVGTQFFRFKMADPDTTVTVTVGEDTIAGRPIGVFYFNGVEKAVLEFEKGTKYTFIQNDSSNATYASIHHPLMFSSGDDGEHNDHGHYMSGVVFKLDGVTVNMAGYVSGFVAAIDRRIEWTVPSDAPSTLHYWCHFHTGQGAAMTVTD